MYRSKPKEITMVVSNTMRSELIAAALCAAIAMLALVVLRIWRARLWCSQRVRLDRSPVGRFTGRLVNWFTLHCTLSSQDSFVEGGYMDEPTKRIPDWLATDLVVIVFSLTIMGAWWWIPF
jgi:hypothetical protein